MKFTFDAAYLALWLLVLFQGLMIFILVWQLEKLRQLVGTKGVVGESPLPVGSDAPDFIDVKVRLGVRASIVAFEGSGGLILFLAADCHVCEQLVDAVSQFMGDESSSLVVFCRGGENACAKYSRQLEPRTPVYWDGADATAAAYGVFQFPTAVSVNSDRKICGYGHPTNLQELNRLIALSRATRNDPISEPELSATA